MTATRTMYRRYRFFKENAGYVVGERAKCAYSLARAEELAESAGLTVNWEWDDYDTDLSWCECKGDDEMCVRCGSRKYAGDDCDYPSGMWPDGHEFHEHEVLYAYVSAPESCERLAGVGGIVDAIGTPYQRVVEAELLAEAIEELNRNEYTLPIA